MANENATGWINASTGWIGRQFEISQDGDKSFIWTPEKSYPLYGGINYSVAIPQDGDYAMEGEVLAPNCGGDSFFVEIWKHEMDGSYKKYDFGAENGYGKLTRAHWRFEFSQGMDYGKWCTIKVNHIDTYVKPEQKINPLCYHLKKGEYPLKITMREDGAKLSRIRFVNI